MTTRSIRRCLLASAASLGLLLTLTAAPGVQAANDDPIDHDIATRQAAAGAVLDQAQEMFSSGAARRDASMVLRDLALAREDLSPEDLVAAREVEKRPAKPAQSCNDAICVHYAPGEVNPADANANAVPDYIDFTLKTVNDVRNAYIAAGYREPLPDGTNGGDARFDVYIDNIGPDVFGFCTTDAAGIPKGKSGATWAYCVLDNDYSKKEFSTNTPTENLAVTAAHEYFHATQYAYNFLADRWLLESTATWMEDEMYDGVDDNLQYLPDSSLTRPETPLDSNTEDELQYGNWIFWRYLTETDPAEQAGLPTFVRDVMVKIDSSAGGPNRNSLQALEGVLRARGKTLPTTLAQYHAFNREPGRNYEEGRANKYKTAKPAKKLTLSPGKAKTGSVEIKLDHLSAATTRFTPQGTSKKARIKINISMAKTFRGSAAIVSTKMKSGKVTTRVVKLNKQGRGKIGQKFAASKIKYVELTMVNASNRFRCNRNTEFTCAGISKDDNVTETFSARLIG